MPQRNSVLKENYTFLVADPDGRIDGGEHGLYDRDTRFLARWRWNLGDSFATLLSATGRPDRFVAHHAVIEGASQSLAVRREIRLGSEAMHDRLVVENSGQRGARIAISLDFGTDFADLFEVRGWEKQERTVSVSLRDDRAELHYRDAAGLDSITEITFASAPTSLAPGRARFELQLAAKEQREIVVSVRTRHPLANGGVLEDYPSWRARLGELGFPARYRELEARTVDDLRGLLLATPHGPVPAAGIPWFVTVFGRDALLTSLMLLPHAPDIAAATLRYLAAHQGSGHDDFRAEAPGKILHEIRLGEVTRSGRGPHSPYYGSIDATPLFVLLLHRQWRCSEDPAPVRELLPALGSALAWMLGDGDPDGDGFLEYAPAESGEGLTVQAWKDSGDSMSHSDGALARGALAVSEVQGYAYAAYRAAAELFEALDRGDEARLWRERAGRLRERFHSAFWLEQRGTYALALDGDKQPLEVSSSNAGQLLWSGIVPEEVAPRLRDTLMGAELWSGWGIRTLAETEVRYNPLSYHNGSVWPHDTALIAVGLQRYGFVEEARRLRDALFALAAGQSDLRLPELVGGYRRDDAPPVPYPAACRPQAWDAAALVYLASEIPFR